MEKRPLVAQNRTRKSRVAVGGAALFEIALVILLSGPERAGESNFCGDRLAIGFQRLLGFLCRSFLFGRVEENRGAILLAEVRALAIHLSGIVDFPENVEELFIRNLGRIRSHLHYFRMAGGIGANLAIIHGQGADGLFRGEGHPQTVV
jgi:hypothetical protein